MNCDVHGVYKNLRYRLLTIDNQTYIIDLTSSIWQMIFPFSVWMFPSKVYKVEDNEIVEKLESPEVKQKGTGGITLIAGGLAVILATLMRSLISSFNMESSSTVNAIIVSIAVILILLLTMYINQKNKMNLRNLVKLENLETVKLWIKPKPINHFFFILGAYFAFLLLTIFGFWLFIEYPNVLALIFTMMFMFITLFVSGITVNVGKTVVQFTKEK